MDATSKKHPANARLEIPGSMAIRMDVVMLFESNQHRALAAALGVCWRGEGRPSTPWKATDPAEYGGRIIDELAARGVGYNDIMAGGVKAYTLIAKSLVDGEAVDEALGNSDAADSQG